MLQKWEYPKGQARQGIQMWISALYYKYIYAEKLGWPGAGSGGRATTPKPHPEPAK